MATNNCVLCVDGIRLVGRSGSAVRAPDWQPSVRGSCPPGVVSILQQFILHSCVSEEALIAVYLVSVRWEVKYPIYGTCVTSRECSDSNLKIRWAFVVPTMS